MKRKTREIVGLSGIFGAVGAIFIVAEMFAGASWWQAALLVTAGYIGAAILIGAITVVQNWAWRGEED